MKNKKDQKDKIEAQMSQVIDIERPKQAFKVQISLYFTCLIALVISCFFFVAYLDKIVRREIFLGPSRNSIYNAILSCDRHYFVRNYGYS